MSKINANFLRCDAVAKLFGVSTKSIYSWYKSGNFPEPIRLSPRCLVWTKEAIEAALPTTTKPVRTEVDNIPPVLVAAYKGAFGTVRNAIIDGEPWFVGKDILVCLGYSATSGALHLALRLFVANENKKFAHIVSYYDRSKSTKPVVLINESGIHSLLLRSSKVVPGFEDWVLNEMIPAIKQGDGVYRKEGNNIGVITPFAPVASTPIATAPATAATTTTTTNSSEKLSELFEQVKVKADFYDTIQSYICAMPNMSMDKVLKLVKQAVDFAAN